MRTACFVDGYNLYYGMLQGTAYKWLDLPALLSQVLHIQNPPMCWLKPIISPHR